MVSKDLSLQVVKLMLHDACQIPLYPLIVSFEILILVLYPYACGAHHLLMYAGQ